MTTSVKGAAMLQYNHWPADVSRTSMVFMPKKLEMKDLDEEFSHLNPYSKQEQWALTLTKVERTRSQV